MKNSCIDLTTLDHSDNESVVIKKPAKNKYILESSASSKNDSDVVVESPADQAKSFREYR